MGVTQPISWDELDAGIKVKPKKLKSTCDENCNAINRTHSPGCALRTLIDVDGYNIKRAVALVEEAIEYEAVKSDHHDPFANPRKYDPDFASEIEVKRYKEMMTMLKVAVYDYCDCGAKHDGAGHYHWCSTQEEEKEKPQEKILEDIPF